MITEGIIHTDVCFVTSLSWVSDKAFFRNNLVVWVICSDKLGNYKRMRRIIQNYCFPLSSSLVSLQLRPCLSVLFKSLWLRDPSPLCDILVFLSGIELVSCVGSVLITAEEATSESTQSFVIITMNTYSMSLPMISFCSVFFFVSLLISSFPSSSPVVLPPVPSVIPKYTTPVLRLFSLSFLLSLCCFPLLPCWILLPWDFAFSPFPSPSAWPTIFKERSWTLSSCYFYIVQGFLLAFIHGWVLHPEVLARDLLKTGQSEIY